MREKSRRQLQKRMRGHILRLNSLYEIDRRLRRRGWRVKAEKEYQKMVKIVAKYEWRMRRTIMEWSDIVALRTVEYKYRGREEGIEG